jgi:hypothetical protein
MEWSKRGMELYDLESEQLRDYLRQMEWKEWKRLGECEANLLLKKAGAYWEEIFDVELVCRIFGPMEKAQLSTWQVEWEKLNLLLTGGKDLSQQVWERCRYEIGKQIPTLKKKRKWWDKRGGWTRAQMIKVVGNSQVRLYQWRKGVCDRLMFLS